MTQFQKLIKGFAITIAILIAVTIIGSIATAVFAVTTIFSSDKVQNIVRDAEDTHAHESEVAALQNIDETFSINEVDNLKISNSVGNLTIEAADVDAIQVIGVNLSEASSVELSGDTLYIDNTSVKVVVFGINMGEKVTDEDPGVTVKVPRGFAFEEISVDSGVGTVTMDGITTRELELSSGTGCIEATDMTCGDVDIDAGVGSVTLYLNDQMTDYDMDLSPGIGAVYVDDIQQSEINHTNQNADYSLNVDGGVGEVKLYFNK